MSAQSFSQKWSPTDLGINGPTALDMARAFRSVRADPLTFLADLRVRYGDVVALPVPGPPALLINDPADIRRVLQTSARHWTKDTVQYSSLRRVTGDGLLATARPTWLEHRRIAAPAFHHERLAGVGKHVRVATDEALGAWGSVPLSGASMDVLELTTRVALDVVGRALFSADLSSRAEGLLAATGAAAGLIVRLGRSILPIPEWVPTPLHRQLHEARRELDRLCGELITARREAASGSHGDDLLGLLLDGDMDDEAVRDELVTMVIAGHETVAAGLAWTLMLLAEDEDAQARVREELGSLDGELPLVGAGKVAPWTRAVVDESLRLYPPAWALSRRSTATDVLGGHEVPVGTLVIMSPWLVHRHPARWPDPEAFRPDRFLDGAGAAGVDRGYLPFGAGPRLCIGREFALGEMVIVLSRLLRRYRLSVPQGWARPQVEARVALHPRGGMPLVLSPSGGAQT
ncbi:MAG: cytochrome P450 [Knoellia sp.]